MNARIAALYRYPVKGLSPERLQRVELAAGRCLPHDRRFAIALASTRFDPARPEWLAKTHFVMLMRDETLARLATRFDPATNELTIERTGGEPGLKACLTDPAGARQAADFMADCLGPATERPLRVVEAPGHAFADARRKPGAATDQYVSLINLASITALEQAIGASVDRLRFRANVYFDGPPAWRELDWLGREIAVPDDNSGAGGNPGGARLKIIAAITRCAATQVNPRTAERDLDIPAALQRHFGHNLMGVYAEVAAGGPLAEGARLTVGAAN